MHISHHRSVHAISSHMRCSSDVGSNRQARTTRETQRFMRMARRSNRIWKLHHTWGRRPRGLIVESERIRNRIIRKRPWVHARSSDRARSCDREGRLNFRASIGSLRSSSSLADIQFLPVYFEDFSLRLIQAILGFGFAFESHKPETSNSTAATTFLDQNFDHLAVSPKNRRKWSSFIFSLSPPTKILFGTTTSSLAVRR